jgi:L-amino acid N-acyltransferase YncA
MTREAFPSDGPSRHRREAGARSSILPTDPAAAEEGFALFRAAYLRARAANPLVPPLDGAHEARLRARVERAFDHGGAAAWRDGALVGYLVASPPFEMRGLSASLVPEFGHAVAPGLEAELYGRLYAGVAERLVDQGVQLHLVGRLAVDEAARAALDELGFGAIVAERLRDMADVAPREGRGDGPVPRIAQLPADASWDALAPLVAEHAAFYRQSPIFLEKDEGLEAAREDLDQHRRAGDPLFVAWQDGEAVAYLIAGACCGATEGRLVAGTRTAQVRSAYVAPSTRRRGVGSALLQRAVEWAREAGFERMFVEHETANLEGGPFWRRHFAPFVTVSMRYVPPVPDDG